MKRWMTRLGAVAVFAVPLTVAAATGAGAATTAEGSSFGHHVAQCAQTMGFSGEHNPGMHQGITGWMADHPM